MNIFQEVKDRITAREAAEGYGLAISENGMACCPFHDDRHPSMKIDKGYYCFACGAKGDALGYVARLKGLTQYEAAVRMIHDFHLPVETGGRKDWKWTADDYRLQREQQEKKRIKKTKERFLQWKREQTGKLLSIAQQIEKIKGYYQNAPPEVVFASEAYAQAVRTEAVVGYWLDVLCMGTEEEQQAFFLTDRKEVKKYGDRITEAERSLVGTDWKNHRR